MKRPITRVSPARWRTLGNATLALAAVAIIGFTTITPAKADDDDWRYRRGWHEREWREQGWRERREHWRPGFSFYYSYPSYSYYSYPSYSYYSYPSYSYYSYPSYSYYAYPSYGYYGGSDYGYDDSH